MVAPNILEEIKRRLVEGFAPEQIILFGSHARGTAAEYSDIDLLVVCRFEGSRRKMMTAMYRALKGLGIARDIIVMRPEEFERDRELPGTVARPAWREGKIIYAGVG